MHLSVPLFVLHFGLALSNPLSYSLRNRDVELNLPFPASQTAGTCGFNHINPATNPWNGGGFEHGGGRRLLHRNESLIMDANSLLRPRQYAVCSTFASFTFENSPRFSGTTRTLVLPAGFHYVFSFACSLFVQQIYAWSAPITDPNQYTLQWRVWTGSRSGTLNISPDTTLNWRFDLIFVHVGSLATPVKGEIAIFRLPGS